MGCRAGLPGASLVPLSSLNTSLCLVHLLASIAHGVVTVFFGGKNLLCSSTFSIGDLSLRCLGGHLRGMHRCVLGCDCRR